MHIGHSHSFDIGIARELGLNAAIVFNHIIYWLRINAAKEANQIEGKTWMYETQADMNKCLDYLSLEEVKKAVVKLLDAGLLIKGNFNKNPFDKTSWYTTSDQEIIKIKKTLTKAPYGAIDIATGRDPLLPAAPSLYTQEEHKQKEQQHKQQASPDAAVSSIDQNQKKATATTKQTSVVNELIPSNGIYPPLQKVDISDVDKRSITNCFKPHQIDHALRWISTTDQTIKSLPAAIKWAAKELPQIPIPKHEMQDINKQYAMPYDGKMNANNSRITVCSSYVEIAHCGVAAPVVLNYEDNSFLDKFKKALYKYNFQVL